MSAPANAANNAANNAPNAANYAVRVPGKGMARHLPPSHVLLWPAGITLALWATRLNEATVLQGAGAFLLLVAAWWSYWYWQQNGHRRLPIFSAVTAVYWLYFGVQVFWGDLKILSWRHPGHTLSEAAVTQAMLLVLFGVAFMWLGMRSGLGRRLAPKRFPEVSESHMSVFYLQAVLLAGTLMSAYGGLQMAVGEGFRQIILIVQSTVSMTAFVILLQRVLNKKASGPEKIFVWGTAAMRVLLGVASGWLGSVVTLALVCGLTYLQSRRKLPLAALACLLPYVLFFQAGKTSFRATFWTNQVEASAVEKVEFWVNASLNAWQQALEEPSGLGVPRLLALSLSRTSLLSQAANVVEQTPVVVPYQYGSLYSYLAISLIPRLFWPDKPSMNEANQFYQVAYGVTSTRDLGHVSIAVGALTEGYINFSWFGVALVMFLVGALLEFWDVAFLGKECTLLATGIGMAMLPQLLLVEFQLAQYVSGLIQHIFLTLVIFLPIISWRTRGRQEEGVKTASSGMTSARPV